MSIQDEKPLTAKALRRIKKDGDEIMLAGVNDPRVMMLLVNMAHDGPMDTVSALMAQAGLSEADKAKLRNAMDHSLRVAVAFFLSEALVRYGERARYASTLQAAAEMLSDVRRGG